MIKARTLVILVVLGIVAVAGGWYFGTAQEPSEQESYNTGKLMFPDLTDKLKAARRVEITSKGKTMVSRISIVTRSWSFIVWALRSKRTRAAS